SFVYENVGDQVEGELIVSLEQAREQYDRFDCAEIDELLLYVAHGTLHICGLDDQTEEDRAEMRQAEQLVLARLGIEMGHAVPSMRVVE
ncbi:MAG: rRNA maturation RNase YbeY, partial [Planctomycetota bacterium]